MNYYWDRYIENTSWSQSLANLHPDVLVSIDLTAIKLTPFHCQWRLPVAFPSSCSKINPSYTVSWFLCKVGQYHKKVGLDFRKIPSGSAATSKPTKMATCPLSIQVHYGAKWRCGAEMSASRGTHGEYFCATDFLVTVVLKGLQINRSPCIPTCPLSWVILRGPRVSGHTVKKRFEFWK